MTKQQEVAINNLKQSIINGLFLNKDKYEFKEFEIIEYDHFISLYFVVGMKNDEGTYASIVCRDRGQLFIGKRGGITYPVTKKLKNGTYKHYYKSYKHNIHSVIVDQR